MQIVTEDNAARIVIEVNRRDELPALEAAAEKLGGISLRVIAELDEALSLFRAQEASSLREKYSDASEQQIEDAANRMWTEARVGAFMGPEATQTVIEFTINGAHGLRDLHTFAAHGYLDGRT